MKDNTWARGMAELQKSGMPGWPTDPEESAARADLYRRHLDNITDEAWLYAVVEAINNERWFPTVAALRDYAAGYTSAHAFLPESPQRSRAELEADREAARLGLEAIKAAVASAPSGAFVQVTVPVARPMPPIEATDERLTELRKQAEEITKSG